MNDSKLNVSENLNAFFTDLREDVVKGLEEYLRLNSKLSFETV